MHPLFFAHQTRLECNLPWSRRRSRLESTTVGEKEAHATPNHAYTQAVVCQHICLLSKSCHNVASRRTGWASSCHNVASRRACWQTAMRMFCAAMQARRRPSVTGNCVVSLRGATRRETTFLHLGCLKNLAPILILGDGARLKESLRGSGQAAPHHHHLRNEPAFKVLRA